MRFLFLLVLAACFGKDSPRPEGDTSTCPPGVPPPNDPCLPTCGNEIGVGMPCTRGGGQCNSNDFTRAVFCTIDFEPGASLQMCTRPCVDAGQCGSNAVCTGDPEDPNSSKGCVPAACSSDSDDSGPAGGDTN